MEINNISQAPSLKIIIYSRIIYISYIQEIWTFIFIRNKDKEINRRDEICNQLIKNGSELASVIFEKLQDTDESYKIFRHDYTKEGDSHFDFFVGSVRNGEISTIFTPVGELIFSRLSKSTIYFLSNL